MTKIFTKKERPLSNPDNNIIPFSILSLPKLDLDAPPARLFEDLMEVEGDARFVAFWYEHYRLYWSNGVDKKTGNSTAWMLWRWTMSTDVLMNYRFGYEKDPPRHHLILDRRSRKFYAVQEGQSDKVMLQQYRVIPAPLPEYNFEDGIDTGRDAMEIAGRVQQLKEWIRYKKDEAECCAEGC